MTVVVGYVDESNRKIVFGGDTCICYGDFTIDQVKDKVHVVKVPINNLVKKRGRKTSTHQETEDMILGYAGSWGSIQGIRHNIAIPPYSGQDLMDYMVRDIAPAMKELAELGESGTLSVMVGFKGRIFEVDEQFSVTENFKPYHAIGSGVKHATASLYSNKDLELSAKERVERALECAAHFVINVRPPFTFHEISYWI